MTSPDIPLNDLRLDGKSPQPTAGLPALLPAKRPRGKFLRGPIPWDWTCRAACLPGKALTVGLAIWHRAGLDERRSGLVVSPAFVKSLGVNRKALYAALAALETAGLVRVVRSTGRAARVDLVVAE